MNLTIIEVYISFLKLKKCIFSFQPSVLSGHGENSAFTYIVQNSINKQDHKAFEIIYNSKGKPSAGIQPWGLRSQPLCM